MNGVAPDFACGVNDCGAIQIGGGTDTRYRYGRIRHTGMQRLRIVFRVYCPCRDAHIGGGAGNADRDFTAICDKQFLYRVSHDDSNLKRIVRMEVKTMN